LEGRWLPSSLSGLVYNDANNDGVREAGEAGLAGATVTLTGTTSSNQAVNLSQHTDAYGYYSFTNLAPGTYALREAPPAGYLAGKTSAGSQGGTAALGSLSGIALGAAVDGTGNNFGDLASASGWSAIQSNFNGTPIQAGTTIWFNSVFKVNGLGASPVTLRFTGQTISFTANGADVTLSVPDSVVTFSPSATTATTTFDPSSNAWVTTLPFHFSGNGFLGGLAFPVTSALPGGIQRVNWQGQLTSDTAGVTVNWQWAAAVYTRFGTDYNALGVKPVDDNQASQYKNSDHAGTPENFCIPGILPGGATGGGGSNWTGSYSGTAQVAPPVVTAPAPASLSGFVLNERTNSGLAGVLLTLTGTNDLGQAVSVTATTAADGSYSFGGLRPGTYALTETPPSNYFDDYNTAGTLGGTPSGNQIYGITLTAGANGLNYDFDLLGGS
jgi:hypothetical protein